MRSLLDTNLLVYADAADEPVKQRLAIQQITSLRAQGAAVLSTQVLQEYVNVALRKLQLPPALIRERLAFYSRFDLVPATAEIIEAALNLHVLHGLSFYDALIVQAAIAKAAVAAATAAVAAAATDLRQRILAIPAAGLV